MADKCFLSIIGEMDRLWYRQVILFSQPTTLVSVSPKPVLISESPSSSSSSSSSIISLQDEETSTDESPSSEKQVSSSESISLPLQDGSIDNKEERLDRMKNNHLSNRIRSHSSSPSSTQNRKSKKPSKLEKSMSCRTLGELELDEVKGFMDLGFIFKKEYINPRIISVVPGLQRLCSQYQNKENDVEAEAEAEEDDVEEEKRDVIMRPYLSEAWLIKRPDSPLLNLKIPKACSASNMKKHLRYWAKTVASEIQQNEFFEARIMNLPPVFNH